VKLLPGKWYYYWGQVIQYYKYYILHNPLPAIVERGYFYLAYNI